MLPRSLLRALVVCVAGLTCSVEQDARAGVTIDLVFLDATSPSGITINAGDEGGTGEFGCICDRYYCYVPSDSAGYCMDVILRTTDDLVTASVRVGYDSDNGLAVWGFDEWLGLGVSWNAKGTLQKSCMPTDGVTDNGVEVGQFDCAVPLPAPPGWISPGTYRLGTIIWDTSGTNAGSELIDVLITGVDAIINGNVVDVSASAVLGSHILTIIPEPGAAVLLGSGLVGLLLVARRRRLP